MGSVIPFEKSWRSDLHERQERPAAVTPLPMEKFADLEVDETLEASPNGDDEHDGREQVERRLLGVRKVRRSTRRSIRQLDESAAAIDDALRRK